MWLSLDDAIEAHCAAMKLNGLDPQHCDLGKLAGALVRPQNRHHYDGVDDIIELAAILAAAVARSHSFTDGNKRTAFALLIVFLEINGIGRTTSPDDVSVARGIEDMVAAAQRGEAEGDREVARFTAHLRTVTLVR